MIKYIAKLVHLMILKIYFRISEKGKLIFEYLKIQLLMTWKQAEITF